MGVQLREFLARNDAGPGSLALFFAPALVTSIYFLVSQIFDNPIAFALPFVVFGQLIIGGILSGLASKFRLQESQRSKALQNIDVSSSEKFLFHLRLSLDSPGTSFICWLGVFLAFAIGIMSLRFLAGLETALKLQYPNESDQTLISCVFSVYHNSTFSSQESFSSNISSHCGIASSWGTPWIPWVSRQNFFYLHVSCAPLALVLETIQLLSSLRKRFPVFHRWSGRLLCVVIPVATIGSVGLAVASSTSWEGGVPLLTLGVWWLSTLILGVVRKRQGDIAAHRRWMIRHYSGTFAAVTLRVFLVMLSDTFGVPFPQAYVSVFYISWIPNAVIAEIYIYLRGEGPLPFPSNTDSITLLDRDKNDGFTASG